MQGTSVANGRGPLLLPIDLIINTSINNNTHPWKIMDVSYVVKRIYVIWCWPAPWESEAPLAVVTGPDEDTASMTPRDETVNVRWSW